MKTIYNALTGEPKTLDFVDAREHIATGRWVDEKPVIEEVKEQEEKPKRGRKPKEQ